MFYAFSSIWSYQNILGSPSCPENELTIEPMIMNQHSSTILTYWVDCTHSHCLGNIRYLFLAYLPVICTHSIWIRSSRILILYGPSSQKFNIYILYIHFHRIVANTIVTSVLYRGGSCSSDRANTIVTNVPYRAVTFWL